MAKKKTKAEKQFTRHLSNSRREIKVAVERFAEVDPLPGHCVEAARLARAVRDEADKLVETLGGRDA